jgi:double-stranded uracil-DNA glycosylase
VLPTDGRRLRVLFCGINPGLVSAATRQHFARPGNRFWPALHRCGFTPRQLRPDEQWLLPEFGLGITNVSHRPTARADELSASELVEGGQRLVELVRAIAPVWLAVVGVTAYRVAFGEPRAAIGRQDRTIADTRIWVLPNPSGLNASWTTPRIVQAFTELRQAIGEPRRSCGPARGSSPLW